MDVGLPNNGNPTYATTLLVAFGIVECWVAKRRQPNLRR